MQEALPKSMQPASIGLTASSNELTVSVQSMQPPSIELAPSVQSMQPPSIELTAPANELTAPAESMQPRRRDAADPAGGDGGVPLYLQNDLAPVQHAVDF